jgi:hypothetical protein
MNNYRATGLLREATRLPLRRGRHLERPPRLSSSSVDRGVRGMVTGWSGRLLAQPTFEAIGRLRLTYTRPRAN